MFIQKSMYKFMSIQKDFSMIFFKCICIKNLKDLKNIQTENMYKSFSFLFFQNFIG